MKDREGLKNGLFVHFTKCWWFWTTLNNVLFQPVSGENDTNHSSQASPTHMGLVGLLQQPEASQLTDKTTTKPY